MQQVSAAFCLCLDTVFAAVGWFGGPACSGSGSPATVAGSRPAAVNVC